MNDVGCCVPHLSVDMIHVILNTKIIVFYASHVYWVPCGPMLHT